MTISYVPYTYVTTHFGKIGEVASGGVASKLIYRWIAKTVDGSHCRHTLFFTDKVEADAWIERRNKNELLGSNVY